MITVVIPRGMLPLLFAAVCMFAGRSSAADTWRFTIPKPDDMWPISVGEKESYVATARTSGRPDHILHFSYECVGRRKWRGKWYGRCLVEMNGKKLAGEHLAPLWSERHLREGVWKLAISEKPGTTKVREKTQPPEKRGVVYYRKKTVAVGDHAVLGQRYQRCVRYREERYNNMSSLELWIAPGVGVVEGTVGINVGKDFSFSMNTRLESIRWHGKSS